MADFQYPDLLGQYVRGQMAPGELQAQQQGLTEGGLRIDQLRLALQGQQMNQQVVQGAYQHAGLLPGGNGAQNPGGSPGGMQNGPQGAVGAPQGGGFTPSTGAAVGMLGFSPEQLGALSLGRGDDPLKTATGLQDYQKTQAQLQAQGPLNMMDSIFNSDQPAKTVMNNPSLIAQWPKFAQQIGVDPVTGFNDQNVRRALALAANNVRGTAGMPAKDYPVPVQNRNLGQGEVGQINAITGKKEGDLVERQTPGYSLIDKWDPNTNTSSKVPVQTSGYGMRGAGPGGAGATPGYELGPKAPTDPELKAAMFGSEMRSGMQKIQALETRGVNLSPAKRAAFINAATSEDSGMIAQFMGQVALGKGFTKDEQTYMAALMPMLQAAGHDQSGARLTTSQVRQNLESLIPIDGKNKEALAQVNANREGFYTGLLTQAGSATQLPQYRDSLASDLKKTQTAATAPKVATQANVQEYAQTHKLSYEAALKHVQANGYTVR